MKKTILYILGGIACFVLAGALTFGALSLFRPTAKKDTQTSASSTSNSASTIVAAFVKAAPTTKPFDTMAVQETSVNNQTPALYVKSSELSKYVGVQGSKAASIKSLQPVDQTTLGSLLSAIDSFMSSNGFAKQTDFAMDGMQATYISDDAACSLSGVVNASDYTLVCDTKTNYISAVASTAAQLNAWPAHSNADYEIATQRVASSEDNAYSVSLVTLYGSKGTEVKNSLLYTKHGPDWTYITDTLKAADGSTNSSNGKTAQNDLVTKTLDDTNYGPLLSQLLGMTNTRS